MELNRHICNQLVEKARAFTQITLDDDYIVRDNKPDVVHIIYTKGTICLEDVKAGSQSVWVMGKLCFESMYKSDDDRRSIDSVTGEIPFQEKIVMEEINDEDRVDIKVEIEDLSVGIINSRKLVVRAVLSVLAKSEEEVQSEITCRLPTENHYEQKTTQLPMLCLVDSVNDHVRVDKEVLLPSAKGNINEIVFYQTDFRNEEIMLRDNKAVITMDVLLWVLYKNDTTKEYEYYETTLPLSEEIELYNLHNDEIFWSKVSPENISLEARADYDGEMRMFGLSMTLNVSLLLYREETCEQLVDAYSLEHELVIKKEPFTISQFLLKNISKTRILEQIKVEPTLPRILQICGCSGNIIVDHMQRVEEGLKVDGILNVHILYSTTDDEMPFAHHNSQVPFEQTIEITGLSDASKYWTDQKIEQLQVNLLDNMEYEVKAILQIGIFAQEPFVSENIVDIQEEPLNMDELQKQAGMIGCVCKEGEELWDIAKRYHATPENIMEIGDKVLVVKQVHK